MKPYVPQPEADFDDSEPEFTMDALREAVAAFDKWDDDWRPGNFDEDSLSLLAEGGRRFLGQSVRMIRWCQKHDASICGCGRPDHCFREDQVGSPCHMVEIGLIQADKTA